MKIMIEIPNYEFDNDVKDKFQDYFKRVKADIADGTLCGNYELETTDMFLASFKRLKILPDNTLQEVTSKEWLNKIIQAREKLDDLDYLINDAKYSDQETRIDNVNMLVTEFYEIIDKLMAESEGK